MSNSSSPPPQIDTQKSLQNESAKSPIFQTLNLANCSDVVSSPGCYGFTPHDFSWLTIHEINKTICLNLTQLYNSQKLKTDFIRKLTTLIRSVSREDSNSQEDPLFIIGIGDLSIGEQLSQEIGIPIYSWKIFINSKDIVFPKLPKNSRIIIFSWIIDLNITSKIQKLESHAKKHVWHLIRCISVVAVGTNNYSSQISTPSSVLYVASQSDINGKDMSSISQLKSLTNNPHLLIKSPRPSAGHSLHISTSLQLSSLMSPNSTLISPSSSLSGPGCLIPKEDDYRTVVFCFPEMQDVANKLVDSNRNQFRHGYISWKSFPDGWPNIHFEDPIYWEDRDVVFLCSFFRPDTIFQQLSVLIAFPRNFPHSMTIVVPYFGPATMERVPEEGVLATAETLSTLISTTIPLTTSGPAALIVYDIHTLSNRFYFKDNIRPRLCSAIPILIQKHFPQIEKDCKKNNLKLGIAFPDAGASKRFAKFFKGYHLATFTKKRIGDQRILSVLQYPADISPEGPQETRFAGYHIVIIDDLIQSGTTLYNCKVLLESEGCSKISCFVTHGIFPNNCWKRFLPGNDRSGFANFFVSNSTPVSRVLDGKPPFIIVDITQDLAKNITALNGRPQLRVAARMQANNSLYTD